VTRGINIFKKNSKKFKNSKRNSKTSKKKWGVDTWYKNTRTEL